MKWKKVGILKKSLNITFINPNTEEQIVQSMAGVLAYSLAENDEKIKFAYSNSNAYQNSHEIEDELELWWDKNSLKKFCKMSCQINKKCV